MNEIELICIYLWQLKNLQRYMVFIIIKYPAGENWKTFLNLFEASGSTWLTEKQQTLLTSLLDMFALTSLTVNPRRLRMCDQFQKWQPSYLTEKFPCQPWLLVWFRSWSQQKQIGHYSINTYTSHVSFLFWSVISFHHPLTVEWDDFHSLREYIANVHRFREFLEDSRWQWE